MNNSPRRRIDPQAAKRLLSEADKSPEEAKPDSEGGKKKKKNPNRNEHQFYVSNRGKRLTLKLRSGEMLKGVIESWDQYTLRLDVDGDTVLVHKHAIDAVWQPGREEGR